MSLYHAVCVTYSTPQRGKVALQWRVSKEIADGFVEELRERLGEPTSESMIEDADTIDAVTRTLVASVGYSFITGTDDG